MPINSILRRSALPFTLLLLAGCSSNGLDLAGPSDAFDGAIGAMSLSSSLSSLVGAFDDTQLTRVDFTQIQDMKVVSACAVALDGVRIGEVLTEEACKESPETFSERLDGTTLYAPVLSFLDLAAGAALSAAALANGNEAAFKASLAEADIELDSSFAESSVGPQMILNAKAAAVGIHGDIPGCAAEYSLRMAKLRLDQIGAQCTSASLKPSELEVETKLEDLTAVRKEAYAMLNAGQRLGGWTASKDCAGAQADNLPLQGAQQQAASASMEPVGATIQPTTPNGNPRFKRVIVASLLKGEGVSASLINAPANIGIELWDATCENKLGDRSEIRFRVPETGNYVFLLKNSYPDDVSDAYFANWRMAAILNLSTDGEGGPSFEEKANAEAYASWFDSTFPGVTVDGVETDVAAAVKQAGEARKVLEGMIAMSRERGIACAAKSVATKDMLAITSHPKGQESCTAELEAAVETRIAIQTKN